MHPNLEIVLHALQEGSHDGAKTALTSFQSLVSNQLAKMEKDFKSGGAFPDLPIIRDTKAFQVAAHCLPAARSGQVHFLAAVQRLA